MKISDSKGARVHSSLNKSGKITWRVNFKTEGVWCNSEKELIDVLRKITFYQLHDIKTWTIGKDGWNYNADHKERIDGSHT